MMWLYIKMLTCETRRAQTGESTHSVLTGSSVPAGL